MSGAPEITLLDSAFGVGWSRTRITAGIARSSTWVDTASAGRYLTIFGLKCLSADQILSRSSLNDPVRQFSIGLPWQLAAE